MMIHEAPFINGFRGSRVSSLLRTWLRGSGMQPTHST
jgi:hypothetical protein